MLRADQARRDRALTRPAAPARGGGPLRVKNDGNAEKWLDGEAAKIPEGVWTVALHLDRNDLSG